METQTRFDLDTAIANWQRELATQPDLTPVVRRELETHLRDTVAELQGRGLNNEESFWLARRRLGPPQQLGEEFTKCDLATVWRERVFWMTLTLLTIQLWGISVSSLFALLSRTRTIGRSVIMANGFHLFFYWLPLLAGAVLLAKGRIDLTGKKWFHFLDSRVRLAATGFLWISANAAATVLSRLESFHHIQPLSVAWYNLWSSLFYVVAWPYMLLILLIWLMPRQTSSTALPA